MRKLRISLEWRCKTRSDNVISDWLVYRLQEIIRFQNVLQHSAFKSNPMETIKQHVQNTFQ
jgi:hypothetical protein